MPFAAYSLDKRQVSFTAKEIMIKDHAMILIFGFCTDHVGAFETNAKSAYHGNKIILKKYQTRTNIARTQYDNIPDKISELAILLISIISSVLCILYFRIWQVLRSCLIEQS